MKKYKKIYDFYLEEDEEFLIKYLVPEYYVEQNIDKNNIEIEYAINFLQNELNDVLSSFVNGGFSHKGFILYPLINDVSQQNIKKIKRLKKVALFLNNNGFDFSNSIKKYKDNINSADFVIILSALYRDFSLIKNKNINSVNKFKCKELGIDSYRSADLDYLRPLNELKYYANNYLKEYVSGFYLHGSLATKDYVKGWSDVDTLVVVSKNTINDPKKLLELRNRIYYMRYFFYRIDPLQHHGSTVISEYDLNNYCQAYFPVQIFEYVKSLFKEDIISKFKTRNFSSEALKKLFWFVNYFRKMDTEKRFKIGSYDTKILIHSITLFPTLYLQAKGILVYKKFSFDITKKDFKKDTWKIIDEVSSIRSNWKDFSTLPLIHSFSKMNPLLYYQLNSKIIDLFKDAKKENKIQTEKIIKNIFKLSEEAWSKIKENVKSKKL